MGCICSRGASANEYVENHPREKETRSSKTFITSSRKDEVIVESDGGGNDATTRLMSDGGAEDNTELTLIAWQDGEKDTNIREELKRPQVRSHSGSDVSVNGGGERGLKIPGMLRVPNANGAASIAAGWPSWLTAVAGEAISGLVPRRAEAFEKQEKIGQGTYSSVYKARDLDTGKIVAMKKVRFMNMDPESVRFMAREIHILRKLDHPNVMKLECLVTSRVSGSIYLVFEYMEHDLAGLAARPGVKFTESQIKCYMQQLLRGLEHCHSRGVLHRDIKGSNLLVDNNGNLKIGDFGLATIFSSNLKQPLTSRVVTLWYRPPELLLGSTCYDVAVDLWSAGCILAELFHGKPIMPGRTEVEQLHKIFKLCGSPSEGYWKKSKLPHATVFKPQQPYRRCVVETFKDLPPSVLTLLDILLAIKPEDRGSASLSLQNEFFSVKPLPCDPSMLPKYPPSKEFDARRRDDERRKKSAAGKDSQNWAKQRSQKSKGIPAPDANAELQTSILKRYGLPNAKSRSEKFNAEEDGGSGFPLEPPIYPAQNGFSHSGGLMCSGSSVSSNKPQEKEGGRLVDPEKTVSTKKETELRTQRCHASGNPSNLSRFASSVGIGGSSHFDDQREAAVSSQWPYERYDSKYDHIDDEITSQQPDWSQHFLDRPKSSNKKQERASGNAFPTGYAPVERVHCSGPLLPVGRNIDEMLKEHEKQVQQAVRKARADKAKTRKAYSDVGLTESLLHGKSDR